MITPDTRSVVRSHRPSNRSRRARWAERPKGTRTPAPIRGRRCLRFSKRIFERLSSRAQCLLVEFSDARLRHFIDEANLVGQPPLHEARREMFDDLVGANRVAALRAWHDVADRPLGPLLVRQSDHARFEYFRMGH